MTVKDRMPKILTQVIDTIHNQEKRLAEQYGEVHSYRHSYIHTSLHTYMYCIHTGRDGGCEECYLPSL